MGQSLQGVQKKEKMLIPKEELRFDFQGAQFDLSSPQERQFLGWIFNQFLYGEVTGIQCGYWLYRAPHLNAASFLARQASEELAHVRKFLRILSILGQKPEPAHWGVRFLSSGMMGKSWGDHVAIEMALGEGLVLGVFYAMIDTLPPGNEIQKLLESSAGEEEKHVEFGEAETLKWIEENPGTRIHLLGRALIQLWALGKIKDLASKKVIQELGPNHPVGIIFNHFYEHTLACFEKRIERLGLCLTPISQLSFFQKAIALSTIPYEMLKQVFRPKAKLLTETYLNDPVLMQEKTVYEPSASKRSSGR